MKEMKKRFARPIDTYLHKTFNTFIIYVHWKLKFHTFDSTNNHLTTERFVFLSHSPFFFLNNYMHILLVTNFHFEHLCIHWYFCRTSLFVSIWNSGKQQKTKKKIFIKLNSLVKQHAWSHVQLSFNYWKLWDNYNRKVCCFCFILFFLVATREKWERQIYQ